MASSGTSCSAASITRAEPRVPVARDRLRIVTEERMLIQLRLMADLSRYLVDRETHYLITPEV